jgi:transcriptional regulator with XRE-family HTH domain
VFADLLREARAERDLSVAELAERAGTSRAAIMDYEAGRKQPQFDTAVRLLQALGKTLTTEASPTGPEVRWRIPDHYVSRMEHSRTDPKRALDEAQRELPVVLESDAELENLGMTWGEIKTVADGITVAGPPLRVDRLWGLRRDIVESLRAAARGKPESLRATGDHVVSADKTLPSPERELDFLVRATASGAEPARVRHLASASLASRGFPYLWVPFKRIDDYGKGVVATRLHGDGTRMLDALTADLSPTQEHE